MNKATQNQMKNQNNYNNKMLRSKIINKIKLSSTFQQIKKVLSKLKIIKLKKNRRREEDQKSLEKNKLRASKL